MKIKPIDRISLYGIRTNRDKALRDCKKVVKNIIPVQDKELVVHTAIDSNNNKIYKLHYLRDKLGRWIKSKLVYFKDNKRYKILRSEKGE